MDDIVIHNYVKLERLLHFFDILNHDDITYDELFVKFFSLNFENSKCYQTCTVTKY